jgi:hypothetical protein
MAIDDAAQRAVRAKTDRAAQTRACIGQSHDTSPFALGNLQRAIIADAGRQENCEFFTPAINVSWLAGGRRARK